jgi:hypothetical protein
MIQTQNTNMAFNSLEKLRLRLLDLTARNRLINFRHTKKGSLRIIDELPNQLIETLLTETEMRFLPVPEPTREDLISAGYIEIDGDTGQEIRLLKDPTAEEWAKQLDLKTSYEVPKSLSETIDDRHTDKDIQTLFYPYELEARLKNLAHTAESAIQEMGANILYLAFGFLEWYENNNGNSHIAPLFLMPARLQKGRLNPRLQTYEYRISYSGEDIIPNLSLREKLRVDFGMALPDLDENTKPEDYFDNMLKLIEDNQPRWRLRRFITLTLLNFSKLLMYLDLDPSRWPESACIIDYPVVKQFLAGYKIESDSNISLGFGEEYPIDEIMDIHTKYPLIEDADSSQHSALIDAIDGKNLVIEGPPGTGKSQTITNLIAEAMAQGKRVLFVAEKLAALKVVSHRLDVAGLGEFCLELHSHKTQKRKVLDDVEVRLRKRGQYRMPKDIGADIVRYEELKTALKNYVELINQDWMNTGKTLHDIFMAAVRFRETIDINPDALHPEGCDGNSLDVLTQRRMEDQVEAFRKVYQIVLEQLDDDAELQQHPWYGVRNTDLQIFDLNRVQSALIDWQHSLQYLNEERVQFAGVLDCELDEIADSVDGMSLLLEDIEKLPPLKGDELLDRLPALRGKTIHEVQSYLKLFKKIQSLYELAEEKIEQDVLEDLSAVDIFLAGSEQLSHLVDHKIKLGFLAEAINRFTSIQSQLIDLDESLKEIRSIVGEDVAKYLLPTETGLTEFKIFVNLVADLKPSYWKLRDELFDNEEMDVLLPQLRNDLEKLYSLRNELQDVFLLDALPNQNELKIIRETLDAGGIFHWFKSGWRKARKQVLNLAVSNKVGFSKSYPLLKKAGEFSGKRQTFNRNDCYQEVFGKYLKGFDTNLPALESLREWYKKVRQQYGVGFGKKVVLGNAILELPINTARAMRSLSDRGVQGQLNDLLNELVSLKKIFSPVTELKNNRTLLIGKSGIIPRLLASLDNALQSCKSLMSDDTISISELASRISLLDLLKRTVSEWEAADCDNKIFLGRLGLKVGVHIDNSSSLSVLQNTLAISAFVDQQLNIDIVKQRIYDQPESSTFSTLMDASAQLKMLMELQTTKFNAFAQLVDLEPSDWMKLSGKLFNKLIVRNDQALNNSQSLQNWLDYVRIRQHSVEMGLAKLIIAVEQGKINIQQVDDAYKAGIYDVLAREILRTRPELGRFSGHTQEVLQDQFREYDNRLKNLQCERVAWQIDQTKVPEGSSSVRVSERTELFLLKHECSKKRRHLPLRQLILRAGGALVALKPCFMMGPMSVAQYLAPGQIGFDLIVMDEASQIKPQDALAHV